MWDDAFSSNNIDKYSSRAEKNVIISLGSSNRWKELQPVIYDFIKYS